MMGGGGGGSLVRVSSLAVGEDRERRKSSQHSRRSVSSSRSFMMVHWAEAKSGSSRPMGRESRAELAGLIGGRMGGVGRSRGRSRPPVGCCCCC